MAHAALLGALALLACAPAGRPIVAEVYYDANGDDTGWEFVELYNPHAHDVPLAGARLEAGDGSAAARWTLRWTGGARDTLRARSRFVVGGARVVPAPDAIVTLELQNGPDAVRLTWPDGAAEVVGWGAHEFAEYACGASAADVPSGLALARVPDESDAGANALDFRAAPPSPGAANQAERDAALVRGTLRLSPPRPAPGAPCEARVRVANAGRAALAAGEGVLEWFGDALAAAVEQPLPALERGDSIEVTFAVIAGFAGRATLRARVTLGGDGAAANDADTLLVRVGEGPLELTEIQFHPAQGEGEWVEVRNRSGTPLRLDAFTFADRTGAPSRLVGGAWLAADSLAVIAQDRAAFARAFPFADTARVVSPQAWASLNNSNDESGTADVAVLREADGLVCDEVAYSASGVAAGVPVEKFAGEWAAAPGAPGTPLAPPRPLSGTLEFALAPREAREGGELAIAWRLPWARARVAVELFDLEGRRVAVLLHDVASTAAGERRVKLEQARAGLFVARLRAVSGAATLTRATLLRIARSGS